jgi:hypothetical protein
MTENPGRDVRLRNAGIWLLVVLLLSPWIAGLLAESLEGRARTIPETLFWVSIGVIPFVLFGTARGRDFVRRQSRIRQAIATVLLGLVAVWSLGQVSVLVADWLVPLDRTEVTISAAPFGARYVRVTLVTADMTYETPMFWTPRPGAGPARLTLGHFSRRVLAID